MLPLNPVRKFAVLSGMRIGGFCLALALGDSYLLERQMREEEWLSTAEVVRYEAEAHNLLPTLTGPKSQGDDMRYRDALQGLERLPGLVRIKVGDRTATIRWANDGRLVGQRFPEHSELRVALAGELKSVRELARKYGEERFAQLAEIYVPLTRPWGETPGVIEVYKQPLHLVADILRMRLLVWGIVLAGGILLNCGLFPWTKELKAAHR